MLSKSLMPTVRDFAIAGPGRTVSLIIREFERLWGHGRRMVVRCKWVLRQARADPDSVVPQAPKQGERPNGTYRATGQRVVGHGGWHTGLLHE